VRLAALAALLAWTGTTLLLSRSRWFARRRLVDQVRPFVLGPPTATGRGRGLLTVESFSEVVGPLASEIGSRLAGLFGVEEDLASRLARFHSPVDATVFRVRQLGWGLAAMVPAAAVAAVAGLPPLLDLAIVLCGPLLAFLVLEQSVNRAAGRWQQRLVLELPVVAEQLGMLLNAGYSLGAALGRLAVRSGGACGRDLQDVVNRVRQGLTEQEALTEWADRAAVPEVRRLVRLLSLHHAASDLGRLISAEARSIRQEVQRHQIEAIERRGQQVWIPVTVATLLPGAIFLAVPFAQALRLFTG
jgi:Flp pilus assembly protein TadB